MSEISSGETEKRENGMQDLAQQIADKLVHEAGYFSAILGLVGVILGSLLTIVGNLVAYCLKQRAETKRNEPRRRLLRQMLEDNRFTEHWRKLDTLMHVIGADEATTKRLLLEIGARGSEDGQDLWGLIKYHPFPHKT